MERHIWNAVPTKVLYQRQKGLSKLEKDALEELLRKHNLKDEEDNRPVQRDSLAPHRQTTLARREADAKNSAFNDVGEEVKRFVDPCRVPLKANRETRALDLATIYAEQEEPAVIELRKAPAVKLDDEKASNVKGGKAGTIRGCDIKDGNLDELDAVIKVYDERRRQKVLGLPELILPQNGPTTQQISRLRFQGLLQQ